MTGWAWVHILAAASGLTVALLAATRAGGSRLALPLTLLAVDQFAWNVASIGTALTGDPRYAAIGAIAAPFFTPVAFHFVLRFVGRRQAYRRALIASYVLFSAQAALALTLFTPWLVPGGLKALSGVLLVTALPFAAAAMVMVLRHARSAATPLERARARVLLVALVVVTLLLSTELLADLGLPSPRLATLGSFAFNAMLTLLTFGMGLFPNTGRVAAIAQAFLFALFAAVAYLSLFVWFSAQLGLLLTTSTALSLVLAAGGWFLLNGALRARVGLERFATLGRFSAQMAHDLKNPLAAAKGAAEYLAEEMRRADQPQHREFAVLLVDQLERLRTVIDRYQRLSLLEPDRRSVDLNALVTRVLSLQSFAAPGVQIVQQLAKTPVVALVDGDLIASALENLVKNACEAMPTGGTLTLSTSTQDDGEHREAVIAVRDTGRGMDARAREQAFELFFTTKASGSGLGLAFVQQVVEAHGGQVVLTTREGQGTVVELLLPLAS
jgi:two-component system, NtrC family, sensor histidine kinase HydH